MTLLFLSSNKYTEYMLGLLLLRKCNFASLPLGVRVVSYIYQLLVTDLPHTDQFDGCSILSFMELYRIIEWQCLALLCKLRKISTVTQYWFWEGQYFFWWLKHWAMTLLLQCCKDRKKNSLLFTLWLLIVKYINA